MEKERKEYLKNYRKEHLKRVAVDLDMVRYNRLMAHIGETGESASAFVKRAIEEQIRRDVFKMPDEVKRIERDREKLRLIKEAFISVLTSDDEEDDADQ